MTAVRKRHELVLGAGILRIAVKGGDIGPLRTTGAALLAAAGLLHRLLHRLFIRRQRPCGTGEPAPAAIPAIGR
ncbi:hypothetical protein [Kitasatospora sp. NPDC056181]|uniref:hypothetical protein n=1 Tax=Kitasatospora sp. NPDC056181 TaxID=3345737 RepID=UPI0035D957F6